MASKSVASDSNSAKETILLRKPAPKYSFDAKKLPKEMARDKIETVEKRNAPNLKTLSNFNHQGKTLQAVTPVPTKRELLQKPVAVVGASQQSNLSHSHSTPNCRVIKSHIADHDLPPHQLTDPSDDNGNRLQNLSQQIKSPARPIVSSSGSKTSSESSADTICAGGGGNLAPSLTIPHSAVDEVAGAAASTSVAGEECPSLGEQLKAVMEERDKLKAELSAQHQVNTELKRLLVASVGDDLYQRVENLCRDRAQLELDIGGFSKKMSEDYENLDKISIQADMWRSKYLASRVMTEELSSAKAYISLQCHDSHGALHQLLNERHELRSNLIESYKVLQQVKNAFDPLNTHKSSSLRSTSVLELARSCQHLSEAVRFRLLPANVVINVSADVSSEAWQHSLTRAEQFAQEVLSRPVDATSSSGELSGTPEPSHRAASPSQHLRYHPATRYENLTINCCTHCQGELKVV